MSQPRLECYFDCSSPWTYLGFVGLQRLAARYRVPVIWKPIVVGGVFNQVNQGVYQRREEGMKDQDYFARYWKDLSDWAQSYGLDITLPHFHPVNSVKAMRGCLVAQHAGLLEAYALEVFAAYWSRNEDIHSDRVLAAIVDRIGLDQQLFFAGIRSQHYKDLLRANTDELVARGGFGSPTFFVDTVDMYFGNDRLPLVEWKLRL